MGSYEKGSYALGLGYIDPSDVKAKDLSQMMDWFYQANYTGASAIWMQGAIDKRFKIGDATLYNTAYGQHYLQYQKFFFNLIKRHVNMIAGFQRKNRKSTITLPNQSNEISDELADDYNKAIRWCDDRDNFQEYFSNSFEGSTDVGINWLWMYPDYTYDPISGDLFTDSVSFNNVLWDQNFHKIDLTDCQGVWRRRWVSKSTAMALLPGYDKEIKKMLPSGMKDGRFPLQAELQNLQLSNLFTYDEFHYRSTRKAKIVIDPYTNQSMEWETEEGDPKDLLDRILFQQPWLIVKEKDVPTCKMVLRLGDKIVYHGANFLNVDLYPCVPHLCYHEPDVLSYSGRYQGVIRNLRDAQFLYNMRKVIELQILQSQVNAGWIYPVDAVVDQKAFRQSSGGDAFLIPLKAGRQPNEIQRIEPSSIPQSLIELSKSLAEDITKISGVNEELLGSATDDKAGVLAMLRQSAGIVTLQPILDKSDVTQRLYGKLRLEAIRKNFKKSKIAKILGKEPHSNFFNDYSQQYGIAIEEGNYSTTQRQMELQQYLYFKEIGMPIPDTAIMRASFITNKKQVVKEMEEANQQQQQLQQAQIQQQSQIDQVKMQYESAKAQSELARQMDILASAREKEINTNRLQAETEAKNIEIDMGLVKLAMDLENVQFQQIKDAFEFAQSVKTANENKNLQEEQNALQKEENILTPMGG